MDSRPQLRGRSFGWDWRKKRRYGGLDWDEGILKNGFACSYRSLHCAYDDGDHVDDDVDVDDDDDDDDEDEDEDEDAWG